MGLEPKTRAGELNIGVEVDSGGGPVAATPPGRWAKAVADAGLEARGAETIEMLICVKI